jgi:PEP-CTERM motif-containing protein
MKVRAKYSSKLLLLLIVFLAASASIRANGLDATATYTDMLVSPGVYQYDLTLNNTGTTTIGTFWFSWIPGAGFMGVTPTDVMSPAGWVDTITNSGGSVRWVASSPIAAGTSVTGFIFDSTMTPAQFMGTFAGPGLGTGDPITTSTIYIAAPFGDPGAQIAATAAAVVGTPEPSTLTLAAIAMGLLALAAGTSRKRVLSI